MRRSFGWIMTACVAGAIGSPCAAQDGSSAVFKYLAGRAAKCADQRPDSSVAAVDSEKRRSELAAGLLRSLGLPPREPMTAAVTHQKHEGDLVIEEVVYHWAGGTCAAGHIIRLKGAAGRQPGLVVCPGELAHYTWLGYRQFAEQSARAGLIVLFIEDPRIGKRNAADAGLYAVAAAAGMPMTGVQVFDALRALDYLATRPDVDPGRIAVAGFGPGARHAWLAAVLDTRFRFVLLGSAGRLYCLANAPGALPALERAEEPDMAAYLPRVKRFLSQQIGSLPASDTPPLACGKPEKPNFSLIKYFQGRIAAKSGPFAKALGSPAEWQTYRQAIIQWLEDSCGLKTMQPGPAKTISSAVDKGIAVTTIRLAPDTGLSCPAILFHRPASGGKHAAVVLSHDTSQSAAAPEVRTAVERLVAQGFWVLVPDHVSIHPKSSQKMELADVPRFFAAAERAGRSPLGLRVAENLAAFRYLAGRPEIDPAQIVIGGSGIGAVDACLAAAIEPRIAGVAAVNVTTFRDWAQTAAPEEIAFLHVMPYLPGMLAVTDLDYCLATIAPRPMVLARLKAGWSKSGFDQVVATAQAACRLSRQESALTALGLRDPIDERIARAPQGVPKQVLAVAQAILPAPPVPGIVGTPEDVRNRDVVDSASGIVWVLGALGGEEQEFCDGGYRLDTWSFFNDNGAAERGRAVTPLVFKKEGGVYKLTGIGKTRTNTGTGLQTFPFEPAQGSDQVGAGHFFGFYTGDSAGKPNAGVVEYGDDPQHQMLILTLDGGMGDQKLLVGQGYREQSHWPRAYSIQAVSKRK